MSFTLKTIRIIPDPESPNVIAKIIIDGKKTVHPGMWISTYTENSRPGRPYVTRIEKFVYSESYKKLYIQPKESIPGKPLYIDIDACWVLSTRQALDYLKLEILERISNGPKILQRVKKI